MMFIKLPEEINTVLSTLNSSGFEGYVVGGCVRDSLMEIEPKDFDVTTSALPEDIIGCFKDYKVIETGIKHGTVTVIINSLPIEITTYRIDGEYTDNRHPESVRFTKKLREDLSRRDFTVNAMAYSPNDGLADFFDGQQHIKDKLIMCVGEADRRFNEDGLRILRALRFASVLGFEIESETSSSIIKNKNLIRNISEERIYSELKKIICGKNAKAILKKYREVFEAFLPEISTDGFVRFYESIDKIPPVDFIRICALIYNIFPCEPDRAESFLRRLKADKNTIRIATKISQNAAREIIADVPSVGHLIHDLTPNPAELLLTIRAASDNSAECRKALVIAQDLLSEDRGSDLTELVISGRELIIIGFEQGKPLGDVLKCLYDEVLDGTLKNDREELLKRARELKNSQSS